MMADFLSVSGRKAILADIRSEENKARKRQSLKEFNCLTDNLKKYVEEAITSQFSANTKKMMPIVSSINLVKRIVDQQSSVYAGKAVRVYEGLSEEGKAQLDQLYSDCSFDAKSLKMEKIFNLQSQSHQYIRLVNGKFLVQPLYLHNIDVIESDLNPEIAEAYIISNFDKLEDVESDQINQIIADKDDYKRSLERYTLWSKEYNFIFDGNGQIVGESNDIKNEIGIIPIIDISSQKDFTYFAQVGSSLVDFAIDYNVGLSDLMFISRLQGFAQGAVSGDKEVLDKMTSVEMGPAHLIKLPNSPEGQPTKLEFVQRGSDIQGSIQALEILLSNFLTSKGIDPKTISGKGESIKYNSGVERLLAMIERFEAARSNYDLFKWYESEAYNIFSNYIRAYTGTKLIDPMYKIAIPENSSISVTWQRPELIQSDSDKVLTLKQKIELGIMSKIEAIAQDRDISKEEAEEVYTQIIAENIGGMDFEVQESKESNG
jgi:hypothetical protein